MILVDSNGKRIAHSPEAPLNAREKGVPGNVDQLPLGEVGACGWELFSEDFPLPAALIKTPALHHNSSWMKSFADGEGVKLSPHGKTTMCPSLFDLQLQEGAWALTVATPHQLQVARSFGYHRIILANQLIGRSAIEWVADELARFPEFEFYCLIDSVENLEQLALVARRKQLPRPFRVLLEVGFEGGRTGCRSVDQALDLARSTARHRDVIALRGIEGYEGVIHGPDDNATVAQVDAFLDTVVECAQRCVQENLFGDGDILLTAGGSAFFDRVSAKLSKADLRRPTIVLLRGGCYLIHDHTLFARSFEKITARSLDVANREPGLMPALEVWAYVQSLPEPGRAIATLGKRDVSFDELPIPIKWYRPGGGLSSAIVVPVGYSVSHLNDQHCYVKVPTECPWRVGDMVGFGISHPCLTFDKWRVLYLVDDDYRVIDAVRTYF
jgi:D-serine dehydratase